MVLENQAIQGKCFKEGKSSQMSRSFPEEEAYERLWRTEVSLAVREGSVGEALEAWLSASADLISCTPKPNLTSQHFPKSELC